MQIQVHCITLQQKLRNYDNRCSGFAITIFSHIFLLSKLVNVWLPELTESRIQCNVLRNFQVHTEEYRVASVGSTCYIDL